MNSRHYDIIRKDDKSATWLEAASDLSTAESRMAELKRCWPHNKYHGRTKSSGSGQP